MKAAKVKRSFHESTIHIKVVGEFDIQDTAQALQDMVEGFGEEGILATVSMKTKPITSKRAAKLCGEHACEPSFFGLDADGRTVDPYYKSEEV